MHGFRKIIYVYIIIIVPIVNRNYYTLTEGRIVTNNMDRRCILVK